MRLLVSGSVALVVEAARARRAAHLLGLITTPRNRNGPGQLEASGLPWALDNGAYSGFDPPAFRRALAAARGLPGCLFAVCPDLPGDARGTLALWGEWELEVRAHALPACFALQDGQEALPLPEADAYLVGGSTAWKLSRAAHDLVQEALGRGAHVHMGRVTTQRRLTTAWDWGCHSADGSNWSRMPRKFLHWGLDHLKRLEIRPALF